MLKEKLDSCGQTSDQNKELSEKYQLIKQKAQMSLNQQKSMLIEMKEFDKLREEECRDNLEVKKTKFKELEYKVFKIKTETFEVERSLDQLRKKITENSNQVQLNKEKNKILKNEQKTIKREFNVQKIKMHRLLQHFDVDSLEEIVMVFNDQQLFQSSHHLQVDYE